MNEGAYLDAVAYLLEGNGFPSGSAELRWAEVRRIRIQEKDGRNRCRLFHELRDAAREPAGVREFDLQDIGYVGQDFSPAAHEGHKMEPEVF